MEYKDLHKDLYKYYIRKAAEGDILIKGEKEEKERILVKTDPSSIKCEDGDEAITSLGIPRERDYLIMLVEAKFKWNDNGTKTVDIHLPDLDSDGKKECIFAWNENGRSFLEGRIGGKVYYIKKDSELIEKEEEYISFNNPWEREARRFLLGKDKEQKDKELTMPCRWAAGGAIPVLEFNENEKYVVLIRRDEKAPIHPQHFTTASGLSENPIELIDPRIIIGREFGEEIIIFNKKTKRFYKYNFICPGDEDVGRKVQELYEMEYKEKIDNFKEQLKSKKKIDAKIENSTDKDYVDAEIIPLGEDVININLGLYEKSIKGACVLDPIFGAIDVIGAVKVKFNKVKSRDEIHVDDIHVFDFDTTKKKVTGREEKLEFLFRNIFLIKIDDLGDLIKGEEVKCYIHDSYKCKKPLLTPPLRGTLISLYNLYNPKDKKDKYEYDYSESKPVTGIGGDPDEG